MVSHALQIAVARFFAGRTEMVAFHEQHLRDAPTILLEFIALVDDGLAVRCRERASRATAAIDFDRAEFATAVRGIAGFVTQMRDINAGSGGGLDDGLAFFERNGLAV